MGLLVALFFLTALVYSMAGFGGGSTYLALLTLFHVDIQTMRSTALLCNLAVVSYGTICFARAGHLRLRQVLPFVLASIPMAYLGGTVLIGQQTFRLLLGLSLLVAATRMLWVGQAMEPRTVISAKTTWAVGLPLGALLGFLAGIVGIGGGIYLAPVLLLLGWANARQTAAAASFFILVNSIAGLAGQWSHGIKLDWRLAIPLLAAVVVGGQVGSRAGAYKLPKVAMQRITGVLLLAISGRLLWALV